MARTRPVTAPNEASFGADAIERLLRCIPHEMIFVGGQALGYWIARYGIGGESSDASVTEAEASRRFWRRWLADTCNRLSRKR